MNSRLLLEGLEELGVAAEGRQVDQISTYLDELERWNRRMNLVKASGDTLIIRHILDSIAGLPVIRTLDPSSLVDVGSGAGLPGILLAIFLRNSQITLLERSAKRASFLQNAVALLQLGKCAVAPVEIEREERLFKIVCCRALKPLKACFSILASRLEPGGALVFYKGKRKTILDELSSLKDENSGYRTEIVPLSVPFLQEERHLLLFRDTSR